MNTSVVLKVVSPEDIDTLSPLRDIYESAFPANERREFDSVIELARTNPDFILYEILRDNEPAGLFSTWNAGSFVFIEHFATSEKYRGRGIGQRVIESWLAGQTQPVVLEVERPDEEMSRRRIRFYERSGFRLWPVNYMQPAYSIDSNPVSMHLMTYGGIDLDEMLDEVTQQVYRTVYAVALIVP
ncbi:MAG: GNAT family N-acetyltransferase [Bacteroidales bacterium]|jgi:GNAT superfamily N-acetyltransferase|nr:GNAT family N-acetyltransferase [Bacteroidales bacterium]